MTENEVVENIKELKLEYDDYLLVKLDARLEHMQFWDERKRFEHQVKRWLGPHSKKVMFYVGEFEFSKVKLPEGNEA